MEKPRVTVIGMGGTIAGVSKGRTDFETYEPGILPISKLVEDVQPETGRLADVTAEDFGGKGSGDYTVADYYDLSKLVDRRLEDSDAVVVSSGTATMEELAYFLDLTVRSDRPVVVTGAMRPWTVIGSDGPPNLYNAVRLAASNRTRGFGTIVVLNERILPARDATKTDSLRLDSFGTREYGDLGSIDEGGIRLQRRIAREDTEAPFDLDTIEKSDLPRVDIAYGYLDAGGEAITASVNAGAKGIVLTPPLSTAQMKTAMTAAEQGVALVAANGYGAGAVHVDPNAGVIGAGDLAPKKARILLLLSLARTPDTARIATWFDRIGNRQF